MHVRKGDQVVVIAGKEKGKRGRVLRLATEKGRVFIERVNLVKRHTKPTQRSPRGGTPLDNALTEALALAGRSGKKDLIIVFTDGVPDDRAKVAKIITDTSQQIENDEDLTFLFVQVGRDTAATSYLNSLDNDLRGAKFDIVDAKTINEAEAFPTTTALVLAAIAG